MAGNRSRPSVSASLSSGIRSLPSVTRILKAGNRSLSAVMRSLPLKNSFQTTSLVSKRLMDKSLAYKPMDCTVCGRFPLGLTSNLHLYGFYSGHFQRKRQTRLAALIELALLQGQRAAVRFGNLAAEHQPDARAVRLRRKEGNEQVRCI